MGLKKQILITESYSPLYKQLMQKLRGDIASGVYPVHSKIPSEQELCDTYQVSRVTVRKALAEFTQSRQELSILKLMAEAALLESYLFANKPKTARSVRALLLSDIHAGVLSGLFCEAYFRDVLPDGGNAELLSKFRFKHR